MVFSLFMLYLGWQTLYSVMALAFSALKSFMRMVLRYIAEKVRAAAARAFRGAAFRRQGATVLDSVGGAAGVQSMNRVGVSALL